MANIDDLAKELKQPYFFKQEYFWEFRDPKNIKHFDTVESYLNGVMKDANTPSTLYISTINGFPDYLKIGITSIKNRPLRQADPYIGDILDESCKDNEINNHVGIRYPDLVKHQCWLAEQYIFSKYSRMRSVIPKLKAERWNGYTETFKIPDIDVSRSQFITEVVSPLMHLTLFSGVSLWEKMMDQLVASAIERNLYNQRKQLIYQNHIDEANSLLNRMRLEGKSDHYIEGFMIYEINLWEEAKKYNKAPTEVMLNKKRDLPIIL